MSAFICSDKHFSTVSNFLFPDCSDNAQNFANSLKRGNVNSVNYRYSEKNRFKRVDMSKASPIGAHTPSDILKLLQCIDYQSCEHTDIVSVPLSLAMLYLESIGAQEGNSKIWTI